MKLFSYRITFDAGVAPNPFWGCCSLAICKPDIRKSASVGDWIVGTGGKNSPVGNLEDKVIYAMKVTKMLPFMEYDAWCRAHLPNKIPNLDDPDWRMPLGDCLYYPDPKAPRGYGKRTNRHFHLREQDVDFSGGSVLLSDHFYYFGNQAEPLPESLHPLINLRGHKVYPNEPYKEEFVGWIESLGYPKNEVIGNPTNPDDRDDIAAMIRNADPAEIYPPLSAVAIKEEKRLLPSVLQAKTEAVTQLREMKYMPTEKDEGLFPEGEVKLGWDKESRPTPMTKVLDGDGPRSRIIKTPFGTVRWCFDEALYEAAVAGENLEWVIKWIKRKNSKIEAETDNVRKHLGHWAPKFKEIHRRCPVEIVGDRVRFT